MGTQKIFRSLLASHVTNVTSALSPSIPISFSLSPVLAIILIFGFITGNFPCVIVEFQIPSFNSSSSQV